MVRQLVSCCVCFLNEVLTFLSSPVVIRTVLYPVTAIFGPFLNDAVGGVLNESARGGLGVVGQVVNSCESRKLESEADLVALRYDCMTLPSRCSDSL